MKENTSPLSVVFISTLLTPHQIPFCDELYALCPDFTFYQLNEKGEEWTSKGEIIKRKDYKYLKQYTQSPECMQKIIEADVVLLGGCDLSLVKDRLKAGKIVFVYLERFYKKGITAKNFARCLIGTYLHHGRFQKYNVNLLCASAYCAGDAAVFGNYKNRTYKWGYFPKLKDTPEDTEKIPEQIIWVGRLIDWKHAEYAVKAAALIVKERPDAVLKIFGEGYEKESIVSLIKELKLEKNVFLMGAVPSEQVKLEMARSAVFLSTSDYQEGWGAVLNEAMNSRCAVVASHAAGSTPFLIKNGENGFVYECGDVNQIAEMCLRLLNDEELKSSFSEKAFKTIKETWNERVAAERFLKLSKELLCGRDTPFKDGPCSIAAPIRQKKMYALLSGEENA